MAEPNAIFKNGTYMNVNEGKVHWCISLSTKLSNVINITAQCDVIFEILWRPPSLKMADAKAGKKIIWNSCPLEYIYPHTTIISLDETYGEKYLAAIFKMADKSLWDQIEKHGNKGFYVLYTI